VNKKIYHSTYYLLHRAQRGAKEELKKGEIPFPNISSSSVCLSFTYNTPALMLATFCKPEEERRKKI
jgi:hypothetical protein